MRSDKYGQQIYSEQDLCDLLMSGREIGTIKHMTVEGFDLDRVRDFVDTIPDVAQYVPCELSVEEFDLQNQRVWSMPDQYRDLDIAEYVLSLCENETELQRCGEELLLYADRNLFDLLRYLKYLVDTMREHNIIWGVGRGSSVASFVLYKLNVHRINSIYYDLQINEFLR